MKWRHKIFGWLYGLKSGLGCALALAGLYLICSFAWGNPLPSWWQPWAIISIVMLFAGQYWN